METEKRIQEVAEVVRRRAALEQIIDHKRLVSGLLANMATAGAIFGGATFLIGLIFVYNGSVTFPWLVVASLLIFILSAFVFASISEFLLEYEIRRRMKEYGADGQQLAYVYYGASLGRSAANLFSKDEARAALALSGQAAASSRAARSGLRVVHGGVRY